MSGIADVPGMPGIPGIPESAPMPRPEAAKAPKNSTTVEYANAASVPSPTSVSMSGARRRTPRASPTMNGQPATNWTGSASTNWANACCHGVPGSAPGASMPTCAIANTAAPQATASTKRRRTLRDSASRSRSSRSSATGLVTGNAS